MLYVTRGTSPVCRLVSTERRENQRLEGLWNPRARNSGVAENLRRTRQVRVWPRRLVHPPTRRPKLFRKSIRKAFSKGEHTGVCPSRDVPHALSVILDSTELLLQATSLPVYHRKRLQPICHRRRQMLIRQRRIVHPPIRRQKLIRKWSRRCLPQWRTYKLTQSEKFFR